MGQQEGAFGIRIVCDQHSSVHAFLVLVEGFEDLDTFGAWSRTHVKNGVVRLDLEESNGDH